jgi:F-type H+-transporting ATPase subunit delta
MSNTMIASRYAKSLLDLAVEHKQLDTVLADMELFQQALSNRDFFLLLKSPIVKQEKKSQIFKALFEKKVEKLTLSFLDILARKGREDILPEITEQFFEQYKTLKHITTVKVTSASSLSEKQIEELRKKLAESDLTDENIDLQLQVDEELIGGLVVEIGDKMYNASVAHKLSSLKKDLNDNKLVKSL